MFPGWSDDELVELALRRMAEARARRTTMSDLCMFCDEQVWPGEAAPADFRDHRGQPRQAHRECALRSVMGGIGHLENHAHWCVKVGDPDAGLSYRDSAKLVRSWVEEHGFTEDDG